MTALASSTDPFHPEMPPSSPAKMKVAAPEALPLVTTKALEKGFCTCPVGADAPPPPPGMLTDSALFPAESKTPVLLLPFSEIQTGPLGRNETPQGFCRSPSVWAAATKPSETRLA